MPGDCHAWHMLISGILQNYSSSRVETLTKTLSYPSSERKPKIVKQLSGHLARKITWLKRPAFNLIHFIDEIPFERSERQGFGDSSFRRGALEHQLRMRIND